MTKPKDPSERKVGNRKAKHDIAPLMRNAFEKGIGIVARRRGITIPELMASWIEEDWKAVLAAMKGFTVREKSVSGEVEHNHEHKHKHTFRSVSETAEWLAEVTEQREADAPEKSSTH